MKLDVINSITINQMTLMFTEETAYSPSFSTNDTVALFQLPFAFPVSFSPRPARGTAQADFRPRATG